MQRVISNLGIMQLVRAGEPTGVGKLSREKAICKKFSPQNLGCGILWHGKSEQSAKVFSTKIVFFNNS